MLISTILPILTYSNFVFLWGKYMNRFQLVSSKKKKSSIISMSMSMKENSQTHDLVTAVDVNYLPCDRRSGVARQKNPGCAEFRWIAASA